MLFILLKCFVLTLNYNKLALSGLHLSAKLKVVNKFQIESFLIKPQLVVSYQGPIFFYVGPYLKVGPPKQGPI